MFSRTSVSLRVSPFACFLKVLKESNVLARKGEDANGRPPWNDANVWHLYRTMSPASRRNIAKWSESIQMQKFQHTRKFQMRQQQKRLARMQQRAEDLMRPEYVTSFWHFCSVNARRFKKVERTYKSKYEAQQQRFAYMAELWREEKGDFKEKQLKLMYERRQKAKEELQRLLKEKKSLERQMVRAERSYAHVVDAKKPAHEEKRPAVAEKAAPRKSRSVSPMKKNKKA